MSETRRSSDTSSTGGERPNPTQTPGQAQAQRQGQSNDDEPTPTHQTRSGRRYMFIDAASTRSTSREAIRVHVMRESHRVRRQIQGSTSMAPGVTGQRQFMFVDTGTGPGTGSGPGRETPTEAIRAHVMRESHRMRRRVSRTPSSESIQEPQMTNVTTDDPPEILQRTRTRQRVESQRTGGATAPEEDIGQIPLESRSLEELNDLADRYSRTMSQVEQFLPLCRDDEAALSSCLALLTYQTPSADAPSSDLASAQLEAQALETLRSRFAGADTVGHNSDGTILAIALLSRLERSRSNENAATAHEAAVQRLIEERGGIHSIALQRGQYARALSALGFGQIA